MKQLLSLCLVCLSFTAAGQAPPLADSAALIDKKYGFMGVPFGSSKKVLKMPVSCGTLKAGKVTCRATESQTIAGEPIESLLWTYFNDELESVMFITTAKTGFEKLTKVLDAAYGHPESAGAGLIWNGKKARATFAENGGEWTFYMSSLIVKQKHKAADEQSIREGADKL